MKRDFLKNLGIEDKDIIDKIMDEHSADIGKVKGEVDSLKSQITTLTTERDTLSTDLQKLRESTKDYDSLAAQITTLNTEKTDLQNKLTTEISNIQKTHAIENGVRDAKAKNVKAVMALLNVDAITYENSELKGLSEQIEALVKGDDTSFLFGEAQTPSPSGTQLNNPPSGGGNGNAPTGKTLRDAIAERLKN